MKITMEMIEQDPTCDPYYDPPDWKPPRWRIVCSFFWESIAKPPGEGRYVNKLDRGLLFYPKRQLRLDGNEYNYFTTLFNCGYLVGSIPAQMSLSLVRPSIMIPSCEIFWTIMVMLLSRASSAKYIYIFRFIQGMADSICYPTMMMIIGSWYKPEEIAKRVIIWDMTWSMASMFSGYLQAGIYMNLNGVRGIAGWQWHFIIDGCISLPIALFGYFAIPDFPTGSLKRFVRIFTTWRFRALITPYTVYITGAGDYMNLWLAAENYSVQMTNILPTIGNAVALVSGYFFAIISDLTRWRWQLAIATLIPYVFGNLVLGIWNVPFGLKFAANIVPFVGSSFFSQFMAWISEVFQDDTELRGYLPAIGNTIWYSSFGTAVANIIGIYTCYLAAMWDIKHRGLVRNKFGLYVDREDLIDYSSNSVGEIKGGDILENTY
ncbi:major facilitator superfamily domain-containing protein [Lipomyces starkeyi]